MCQGEIEKLCNASQSCHVRKVARLLARPLSRVIGSAHARLVAFVYHAREACKGTFVLVLREKRGEVWLRHLLGTVAIAEMG
jgi:hypothetical protein